jgi:hypothetical protein
MSAQSASTGQPSAPKSVSTPETVKSGRGLYEKENLELFIPPELRWLDELIQKIVDEIESKGDRNRNYKALIVTLTQHWMGLDDEIKEIIIKGISDHGEKYKIVLR